QDERPERGGERHPRLGRPHSVRTSKVFSQVNPATTPAAPRITTTTTAPGTPSASVPDTGLTAARGARAAPAGCAFDAELPAPVTARPACARGPRTRRPPRSPSASRAGAAPGRA